MIALGNSTRASASFVVIAVEIASPKTIDIRAIPFFCFEFIEKEHVKLV